MLVAKPTTSKCLKMFVFFLVIISLGLSPLVFGAPSIEAQGGAFFWPKITYPWEDWPDRFYAPAKGYAVTCGPDSLSLGGVLVIKADVLIDPMSPYATKLTPRAAKIINYADGSNAIQQDIYCALRRYKPYAINMRSLTGSDAINTFALPTLSIASNKSLQLITYLGHDTYFRPIPIGFRFAWPGTAWWSPSTNVNYTNSRLMYNAPSFSCATLSWLCGAASNNGMDPLGVLSGVGGLGLFEIYKNTQAGEEVWAEGNEAQDGVYNRYARFRVLGASADYTVYHNGFTSISTPELGAKPAGNGFEGDYSFDIFLDIAVRALPCPITTKVTPELVTFRELTPSDASRANILLDTKAFMVDTSSGCTKPKGIEAVFSASSGVLTPVTLPGANNINQLVPSDNNSVGIVLKTGSNQPILISPSQLTGNEANYNDYKVPITRNNSNPFKAELYSTKALTVGTFEASVKVDVYYP